MDDAHTASDLFACRGLYVLDLTLPQDAIAALRKHPRTYVRGSLAVDGYRWAEVGVRLKGHGSFQDIDGKPAWKLKFNRFVKGQRFFGLKKIALNNLTEGSLVRERMAYTLFRALDVPTPRAGYAVLYVNRELYGVYLLLEAVDGDFIQSHFDDTGGNLYEGTAGPIMGVDCLEQDEGSDHSRNDLRRLAGKVDADGADALTGDHRVADRDAYLTFLSGEAVSGHWDGYWGLHNFYIYNEPGPDTWHFIPWGTDTTFGMPLNAYSSQCALATACFDSEECTTAYANHLSHAASVAADLFDDRWFSDAESFVRMAAPLDPRGKADVAATLAELRRVQEYVKSMPAIIEAQAECASLYPGGGPDVLSTCARRRVPTQALIAPPQRKIPTCRNLRLK